MHKDFYPTPTHLIREIFSDFNFRNITNVLEPSAGKGDIADYIQKQAAIWNKKDFRCDVIEINENLQRILKGKDHNLIHDDFLTFDGHKSYQLIAANFPFSEGDKHLAKAIEILERSGGELRCLLNAETLKNPFTNLRQVLSAYLEKYQAQITFLSDRFKDAERKTDVEIAFIKLKVPKKGLNSLILDNLTQAEDFQSTETAQTGLVEKNFVKSTVAQFKKECDLGTKLIEEYFALVPYIRSAFVKEGENQSSPLLFLTVNGANEHSYSKHDKDGVINAYLQSVRHKYWEVLINDKRFIGSYTSNVLAELRAKLSELKDFDFTEFNIEKLQDELKMKIGKGIEDAILSLFDKLSHEYHWHPETSKNKHYYNGWRTNLSYKINKKVILPVMGFSPYRFDTKDRLEIYRVREQFEDMIKVFNYLSDNPIDKQLVGESMERANEIKKFDLDMRYFDLTFYKKGTCHIKFKDEKILDKLNIFGSQRKGWLPPSYGKRPFDEMSREEKEVIKDFQGEAKYKQVLQESSFYLREPQTLQLNGV